MPNRIIKESVCSSDSIDSLSWFEEVVFYRLIVNCDDYGRMDARPAILRSRLFPLKNVTDKQIQGALQSLRTAGIVLIYEVDAKPFLQLRTWEKHQQIRAKKSKYPAPDMTCNQMKSDDSKCPRNPIQSESNPNPNPNPSSARRFVPPTIEEVSAFVSENKLENVDPQDFIDFYSSKGWMVGKSSMVDWKGACRRANKWDNEKKKANNGPTYTPKPVTDSDRAESMERMKRMMAAMEEG